MFEFQQTYFRNSDHYIVFFVIVVTNLIACFIFYSSFFPQSVLVAGYNAPSNDTKPQFTKLILMCIDAMRADMVYDFPFTNHLIKEGKALAMIAHAHPPTVTMPRLKAMTSGQMPNFLDIIHNLDSTALDQDNWLYQMKQIGKKLILYGDNTWLKLFPNYFIRSDGTTSFFVTDTVIVDTNVTRHIDGELLSNDWDVMILHYLGLDHVGHVGGIKSPLLVPKQKEMDGIVEKLYNFTIRDPNTLFVLFSDHGMTDQGNHGGATKPETESLFVFMHSKYLEKGTGATDFIGKVNQMDLVPTLSSLFGTTIPKNNIGKLIIDLIKYFGDEFTIHSMKKNVEQLFDVLRETEGNNSQTFQEFTKKLNDSIEIYTQYTKNNIGMEKVIESFNSTITEISQYLTHRSTHYDWFGLVVGLSALFITCAAIIITYKENVFVCWDDTLSVAFIVSVVHFFFSNACDYYGDSCK